MGTPLLRPLRPAGRGGGWRSSDITRTETDSSQLFSTSRAAQRGTHFSPIIRTQPSQPHVMSVAPSQACLPPAKRQEGTEGTLKVVESLHLFPGLPATSLAGPREIPAGSAPTRSSILPHLCRGCRLMALPCVTSTRPHCNPRSLGGVPWRRGSPAQVGNDTSSFQDTELSSCQRSPGKPASKRARHQEKTQRDSFLLPLPVRFLPSITGL